jgi:ABC-type multidrug transport system permease subunit
LSGKLIVQGVAVDVAAAVATEVLVAPTTVLLATLVGVELAATAVFVAEGMLVTVLLGGMTVPVDVLLGTGVAVRVAVLVDVPVCVAVLVAVLVEVLVVVGVDIAPPRTQNAWSWLV